MERPDRVSIVVWSSHKWFLQKTDLQHPMCILLASLRGDPPVSWDKVAVEEEHSGEWKAEELTQEKLVCPMGLCNNRAVDSFLLIELMFLRLGAVDVQAVWGLVQSFWRAQICSREHWNWTDPDAQGERRRCVLWRWHRKTRRDIRVLKWQWRWKK